MKKVLFYSVMLAACALVACNNTSTADDPKETGGIDGKFSVSAEKQVYFSQGNLEYMPSEKLWQFSTSTWSVQGTNNDKVYTDPANWMDLFAWGAKDPLQTEFVEADFATFYDWGNNKISNGGNKAKMWRTLTKDEWVYLYNGRDNAKKLRGFATIGALSIGYVFLPDNWNLPVTFKADGAPEDNKFSEDQWEAMQEAGAVFLPAAGYTYAYEESETDGVGKSGYYWSANPYEGEVDDCYSFYFYSNDGYQSVSEENVAHGNNRYSVRLVRDVK